MGVFVPLLVQPARQCPCNVSSISGTVSARAMGATPSSIIVADMQAMTARDSFVMTNTLLNGTAAATTSIGFTRHSPDDSEPARRVAILQRPWKPDARCGWLPAARAARTMVEGLIWLFSLASGRIPPVDCA